MKEEWKDIPGYEGRYQVSSKGKIKSLARYVNTVNRWGDPMKSWRRDRIMRPSTAPNGYKIVQFCTDGVTIHLSVHRLVARLFVSNPDKKPWVNHKDGNKLNNRCSNLEWVTESENAIHSRHELRRGPIKLDKEKVAEIRALIEKGVGNIPLESKFGVSRTTISQIRNNKIWLAR